MNFTWISLCSWWKDESLHWSVPCLPGMFWFNMRVTHLLCVLAHSPLGVCTFPLSSLQSWQLLSPKLPCGLCFISSSLQDLLSTSLLCSQLLSTPTKVRPPCCLSPSATHFFFPEGCCSSQVKSINHFFQMGFVKRNRDSLPCNRICW